MAGRIDNATDIIVSNPNIGTAQKTQSGNKFSSILDSMKTASRSIASLDNDSEDGAKEALLGLFQRGAAGAVQEIINLPEDEKAEVLALLQNLINAAVTEDNGDIADGSAQDLINSLFGESSYTLSSGNTDIIADNDNQEVIADVLEELQKAISKLDSDSSTDVSEILSSLVSVLASITAPAEESNDESDSDADPGISGVEAVDGNVSLQSGYKTYTLSLDEYVDTMQDVVNYFGGAASSGSTAAGYASSGADAVTQEIIVPGIPDTDTSTSGAAAAVTVPTAGEAALNALAGTAADIPAAGQTVPSGNADLSQTATIPEVNFSATPKTAEIITYMTAPPQRSGVSDKLISEGNIAKASVFSQRVIQKSDELEALNFDLSNTAGLTAQNVMQAPKLEIPQTLSELPPETQVMHNITAQLSTLETGKTSEMTMTLSPENLGQISVKLQNDAGQITVTIAAQSEITQKLLQDKLPTLITNLQNTNPDVKDVRIVEANQNAGFAGFNLNNSDSGQSSSYSSSGTDMNNFGTGGTLQSADEIPADIPAAEYKGGSKLWQTA